MIQIKRAYEPSSEKDGYRILVDRLWPRGVKKTNLKIDDWPKEIAPSTDIRKAFAHDPENWATFSKAYRRELKDKVIQEKLKAIAKRAKHKRITLIYGAHDEFYNHARILKAVLEKLYA